MNTFFSILVLSTSLYALKIHHAHLSNRVNTSDDHISHFQEVIKPTCNWNNEDIQKQRTITLSLSDIYSLGMLPGLCNPSTVSQTERSNFLKNTQLVKAKILSTKTYLASSEDPKRKEAAKRLGEYQKSYDQCVKSLSHTAIENQNNSKAVEDPKLTIPLANPVPVSPSSSEQSKIKQTTKVQKKEVQTQTKEKALQKPTIQENKNDKVLSDAKPEESLRSDIIASQKAEQQKLQKDNKSNEKTDQSAKQPQIKQKESSQSNQSTPNLNVVQNKTTIIESKQIVPITQTQIVGLGEQKLREQLLRIQNQKRLLEQKIQKQRVEQERINKQRYEKEVTQRQNKQAEKLKQLQSAIKAQNQRIAQQKQKQEFILKQKQQRRLNNLKNRKEQERLDKLEDIVERQLLKLKIMAQYNFQQRQQQKRFQIERQKQLQVRLADKMEMQSMIARQQIKNQQMLKLIEAQRYQQAKLLKSQADQLKKTQQNGIVLRSVSVNPIPEQASKQNVPALPGPNVQNEKKTQTVQTTKQTIQKKKEESPQQPQKEAAPISPISSIEKRSHLKRTHQIGS